jgi:para-nitrobenzyl esterase
MINRVGLWLIGLTSWLAVPTVTLAAEVKGPLVRTKSGSLLGLREGSVVAFLGVPYARPPVGDLRWKAPQPMRPWRGLRNAQTFGASCYQEWPAKPFGPFTQEFVDTPKPAEDCLFLNIWRPATEATGMPVFLWIHGGGFGGGSGAVKVYDGANLASRGVVVITVNYRVGPFGFMAHPDLSREQGTSGNYGLEDMIAALGWVRENARAFGADPDRITIAGQSAGAVAVVDLLSAPKAQGLFTAAIAQSGAGIGINAIPIQQAEENGVKFASQLGVSTIQELRALPAEKVQAAIPTYFGPSGARQPRIPFRPVLDGKLLAAEPADGASQSASAVPLITGFTADEFIVPKPVGPSEFEAHVRERFALDADEFLRLYPHATLEESTNSARQLSRDTYMASMWIWAEHRARLGVAPIYVYIYDHPSPAPIGADSQGSGWGTFHTSDVPYFFGNLDRSRRAYTNADTEISKQLQARWLAFIERRDPNVPGQPQWNAVDPDAILVMGIGDRVSPLAPVSTPERMAAFLRFVESGGQLSAL